MRASPSTASPHTAATQPRRNRNPALRGGVERAAVLLLQGEQGGRVGGELVVPACGLAQRDEDELGEFDRDVAGAQVVQLCVPTRDEILDRNVRVASLDRLGERVGDR